jgi:hypothetical protein
MWEVSGFLPNIADEQRMHGNTLKIRASVILIYMEEQGNI